MKTLRITLSLALLAIPVFAGTLTWKFGDWSEGTWDFAATNWNPGPQVFTNGADVRFTSGQITVNLNTTVKPLSVYSSGSGANRNWLQGTGDIADFNPETPTSVLIDGGLRNMYNTNVFSFSGGTTIRNSGVLQLVNVSRFGTGPVTLNNGRFYREATATMPNDVVVEAGGGKLWGNNCVLTWSGAILLRGNLEMGDPGNNSNSRSHLAGPVTLQTNCTISTQGGTISWTVSSISGSVTGLYTLTYNHRAAGWVAELKTGPWLIGGFVKTGPGTTRLTIPAILGDADTCTGTCTFAVAQGILDLDANQFARALTLGATTYTEPGTYGPAGSGADHPLAEWAAYFGNGSTGRITLLPPPPQGGTIMIVR